jgi:hypothetical protein
MSALHPLAAVEANISHRSKSATFCREHLQQKSIHHLSGLEMTEVRRSGETPRDSICGGAVTNAASGGFALEPPKETKTTVS